MDKATKDWLKLLDPLSTRENLTKISVLITAFEFLKESIVENIRDLYLVDLNKSINKNQVYSDDYEMEVLSLDKNKNIFSASVKWLVRNEVIDVDDRKKIYELREYRNRLTHESIKFLSDSRLEIDVSILEDIYKIIKKIDKWWILEVDMPTNPDFSGVHDLNNITDVFSMRMIVLQLLEDIVSDNEKSTELYYNFKELIKDE